MPNVTKIIGAGAKAVRTVVGSNKDIKTNKKINKTLEKTLGTKTISQGKAKSMARNARVKDFMNPITKGKNKNFVKDANKKTLPSAATSRRASVKESNFNSRMEKHPLVRNAGEASAEIKYRGNRGRPVPNKKK
jgi:hypothetical protein